MLSWSHQEPHNIHELYGTGAYAMGHYLFTLEKNWTMTFLVCSARLSSGKFLGIHGHFSHS